MTVTCSVVGCKARYSPATPYSFYNFPKGEEAQVQARVQKWILAAGRDQTWRPGPNARVCEQHFTSRDFYAGAKQVRRLKKNAVPKAVW